MSSAAETSSTPLRGRAVLVTGSTRGIGRAVAARLVAEGADVVVNGTGADPSALDRLVAYLEALDGGRVAAVAGSVADDAVAGALVTTCLDRFGRIDALINVAGMGEGEATSILDISPPMWQALLDVHLTGTFNCCRHAVPHLVAQGSGAIVNTSSHAFIGLYGGTGYAAGKGGVNSLTWALARDLAEHGVRCNAICPGARTDLSSGPDYERKVRELHRRGLLDDALLAASLDPAPPEFVAPMYAYLVSDAARAVTGQVFSVSGNYVGRFPAPTEELLLYRDHADGVTWDLAELHQQLRDRL